LIRMKPLSCDKRVNPSGRTRAVLLSALCAIASSILLTSCSSATLRTDGIAGTLAAGTVSSDLPAVVYTAPEGEEAWYDRSAIVAHALGSVDGRCESNSKEALVQTYSRGQRVFEVDLTLTADNFLVARHDFADDSYYTLEQQKPEVSPYVDCVLTFEELQAWIDSCDFDLTSLPEDVLDNASFYGRIFARSGGLTDAVAEAMKEQKLDFDLKPAVCDGIEQCKVALLKKSKNLLPENFIEGMACVGGCIGGAGCLTHGAKDKGEVDKYGHQALEKTIGDALSQCNYPKE